MSGVVETNENIQSNENAADSGLFWKYTEGAAPRARMTSRYCAVRLGTLPAGNHRSSTGGGPASAPPAQRPILLFCQRWSCPPFYSNLTERD